MLFITELCFYFGTFIVIAGMSYVIWQSFRKTGGLEDIEGIKSKHDRAVSKAWWVSIGYLASIPFQELCFIGCLTVLASNPSWYYPLVIGSIFLPVAIMFYVAWILMCEVTTFAFVGAVAIDAYIAKEYPLRYHASKFPHAVEPEKMQFDWMLKEPLTKTKTDVVVEE